jgi:hypothetical protein
VDEQEGTDEESQSSAAHAGWISPRAESPQLGTTVQKRKRKMKKVQDTRPAACAAAGWISPRALVMQQRSACNCAAQHAGWISPRAESPQLGTTVQKRKRKMKKVQDTRPAACAAAGWISPRALVMQQRSACNCAAHHAGWISPRAMVQCSGGLG